MSLAVVTGGSRGLGYEVAKALVGQGHHVVLVAKDSRAFGHCASWKSHYYHCFCWV